MHKKDDVTPRVLFVKPGDILVYPEGKTIYIIKSAKNNNKLTFSRIRRPKNA